MLADWPAAASSTGCSTKAMAATEDIDIITSIKCWMEEKKKNTASKEPDASRGNKAACLPVMVTDASS